VACGPLPIRKAARVLPFTRKRPANHHCHSQKKRRHYRSLDDIFFPLLIAATVFAVSPARAAMSTKLTLGGVRTETCGPAPLRLLGKHQASQQQGTITSAAIECVSFVCIDALRGYCKSCSGCRPPHGYIIGVGSRTGFGAATARAKSGQRQAWNKNPSARALLELSGAPDSALRSFLPCAGAWPCARFSFRVELAKRMQQEAASAELQVTLAGNLKDFTIATEKSALMRRARNRAKSAPLLRHFAEGSRIALTMLSCISICPWPCELGDSAPRR